MGKGAAATANSAENSQLSDSNALVALAQGQAGQASTLFNASLPGFQKAESFYTSLASGDPYAIARTLAPQAQQVDTASAAAKGNILQNGPAGGEKNLALEQVDVNRGAQVGGAATQGYLNAQNSLAQLSQGGIGMSQNATGAAMSGYNGATSGFGAVGNEAIQQKGQTLNAIGSAAGDATTVATKGATGGFGGMGGGKSGGGGGGASISDTSGLPLMNW